MDYLVDQSGQDFPVIAEFVIYVFFTENDECGDGSIIVGWGIKWKMQLNFKRSFKFDFKLF